jgi:hypothetical protein
MNNRVTIARTQKRKRLTNSEVNKQNKIVEYWKTRMEVYQSMTMEQLEEIKDVKRSMTDKHAYECVVLAKKENK